MLHLFLLLSRDVGLPKTEVNTQYFVINILCWRTVHAHTLVLPILTYACKTWTLLAGHMLQFHVRNAGVSSLIGLGPVLDPIVRRHS